MKGVDALLKLPGKTWRTHFLLFTPRTDQFTQAQTFIKTMRGQESIWYDLYFNQKQLERVWPELEWLPVLDAAKIAYENLESDGLDAIITSSSTNPTDKLTFFVDMMVNHHSSTIPLMGRKPPSDVLRIIPEHERRSLHHISNTNTLAPIWPGSSGTYNDVKIIRADLNAYIDWLRALAKKEI
jgi:hypothetical protein